jgi:hypothetical protein
LAADFRQIGGGEGRSPSASRSHRIAINESN